MGAGSSFSRADLGRDIVMTQYVSIPKMEMTGVTVRRGRTGVAPRQCSRLLRNPVLLLVLHLETKNPTPNTGDPGEPDILVARKRVEDFSCGQERLVLIGQLKNSNSVC